VSRCFYCNARVHNEFTCPHCDAVLCSQRCYSQHAKKTHGRSGSKMPTLATLGCGALLLFGCCFFSIVYTAINSATQDSIARADKLWDEGKKDEAAEKYRLHYSGAKNKPEIVRRMVEHHVEKGDEKEARVWEEKGRKDKLTVNYESAGAKAFVTRLQREREEKTRPAISVDVAGAEVEWKGALSRQSYKLTVKNTGQGEATIRAVVYATNESVSPARAATSPHKVAGWFILAAPSGEKYAAKLTPQDIERNWSRNPWPTTAGMHAEWPKQKAFEFTLKPGEEKTAEDWHPLNEANHKGEKFAKVGFTEYRVWLFTGEGKFFAEKVVTADLK